MLDVHTLDELRTKEVPITDDKPKYSYTSDGDGNYGKIARSHHYQLTAMYPHLYPHLSVCMGVEEITLSISVFQCSSLARLKC